MTTQSQIQSSAPHSTTHDESILVVERAAFFANQEAWSGIKKLDFDYYLQLIKQKQEFLPRSTMELDPRYKQIIPYLVFEHDGRYFLMQRTAHSTETRLKNKYSLGIGGHIRQEDMNTDSLFDWARREFHEEVDFSGTLDITPIGILNDDSNDVGKVHVGFVFLLRGDSPHISVRSELKSGVLYTLEELATYVDTMESWSQYVFHFLREQK